ncbi:hypothetical protein GH714_038775 [Hevea brasiliensis]|uniref:Uncharacterized protein n=1 Tax=Hevea brasiliensis TaxID=3981 RepID=A0A6A6KYV0_HEVBR|nr:hypothetical protein GH714_038775 [Hevea brasiliensis]
MDVDILDPSTSITVELNANISSIIQQELAKYMKGKMIMDSSTVANFSNFAGNEPTKCLLSGNGKSFGTWIVDTGATSHICSDISLFSHTYSPNFPSPVYLPDGTKQFVKKISSVTLHPTLILRNVLHVPSFRYNLLSDRLTNRIIAIGKEQADLYKLDHCSFTYESLVPDSNNECNKVHSVTTPCPAWHERLGHVSHSTLLKVSGFESRPIYVPSSVPLPLVPITTSTPLESSPAVSSPPIQPEPVVFDSSPIISPIPQLRRSTRVTSHPAWLQDFVAQISIDAPLSIAISDNNSGPAGMVFPFNHCLYAPSFNPSYVAFMSNILAIKEPCSYHQAKDDPRWVHATNQELEALEHNQTGQLTALPMGKKPIASNWVYRVKYKQEGSVDRFKARLVTKGYNQVVGIDYVESSSPVAKVVTVECFLLLLPLRIGPFTKLI